MLSSQASPELKRVFLDALEHMKPMYTLVQSSTLSYSQSQFCCSDKRERSKEAKGRLPSSIDNQATIQEPSLISESSIILLLLSLDGPFTFHYQIPQPYQWCCGVLADLDRDVPALAIECLGSIANCHVILIQNSLELHETRN